MNFGLANDPTETTRITHRNVSSPDVAAYRALRITHWTSTPYMDSGHCLISCLVKMVDGIPRLANTLPRRKKATFALQKADWPAFTSLCKTLLATASTLLDIRRGIVRAAERHIPRGSRDSPKTMWTHEMEQAEVAYEAAHEAHTLPHQETACFEPNLLEKEGTKIKPCAVASLCFWKPARKDLGPRPARAGDIFTAWRCRILIPWNRWCSALNLAAYASCLGNRKICLSVILCGFYVPRYLLLLLLLLAALLWFLVTGKWIGLSRRMCLT
ncbi:hypothetical protein C4B63_118g11 [Trypanosoma cruzi]|uniref:Uncharacterized protein n=1 Tax=Trypanosoma cruzi TaxID=5693 RepID=A0A2V2UTH5_TRYCR|nr:hypothetical protein C4B63_118g11 [Trypanosoma cruzi]